VEGKRSKVMGSRAQQFVVKSSSTTKFSA
jgi:hypothetical protein